MSTRDNVEFRNNNQLAYWTVSQVKFACVIDRHTYLSDGTDVYFGSELHELIKLKYDLTSSVTGLTCRLDRLIIHCRDELVVLQAETFLRGFAEMRYFTRLIVPVKESFHRVFESGQDLYLHKLTASGKAEIVMLNRRS